MAYADYGWQDAPSGWAPGDPIPSGFPSSSVINATNLEAFGEHIYDRAVADASGSAPEVTQAELDAAVAALDARLDVLEGPTNATQAELDAVNTALDARLDPLEARVPVVVAQAQPAAPAIWFEVDAGGVLEAIWNVT